MHNCNQLFKNKFIVKYRVKLLNNFLTTFHDVLDINIELMGKESQERKDDKTSKETGQTIS